MGHIASESVLGVIENLPNVERVTTYFRLRLLVDEDDNKFADCAIASNTDFMVTHDKDFKVLQGIAFPTLRVVDTTAFKSLLPAS